MTKKHLMLTHQEKQNNTPLADTDKTHQFSLNAPA